MKRVFALVVLAAILSLGISVYSESGGMILKLADCAQITIPNGLTSINSANWQNNEIGFMKDSDEGLVLLIIHREAVIIPIQEWTNILKEEGYLEVSSSRLASGFDYVICHYIEDSVVWWGCVFNTQTYCYILMANSHTAINSVLSSLKYVHTIETYRTEPTCILPGSETSFCSVCGEVLVEDSDIPAPGHTAGEWKTVKEPTATEPGLKELRCTVCGELMDSEEIPATGAIKKPGDLNKDGTVNGKDSMLLLQYLAGWDVNIDKNNADINGDGTVNGKDSMLLLQYLAGWESAYIR